MGSGFLSALKKIGQVVLKIIGLSPTVMPLLNAAVPATVPATAAIDALSSIIVTAEQMFQAAYPGQQTGAQKLQAVIPYIAALVQGSNFFVGKHIKDQAAFTDGVTQIANGLVATMNSVE